MGRLSPNTTSMIGMCGGQGSPMRANFFESAGVESLYVAMVLAPCSGDTIYPVPKFTDFLLHLMHKYCLRGKEKREEEHQLCQEKLGSCIQAWEMYELQALLAFKGGLSNHTALSGWTMENSHNLCVSWEGVTSSNVTGHVIMLDFSGLNLEVWKYPVNEEMLGTRGRASSKRQRVCCFKSMGVFDALADDLVLDILSRLDPAAIILKAGRVCKRWHRLAHSQELVARKTAKDPDPEPEPWVVLQVGQRLLWYTSLDAILKDHGRELDHGSFSVGPAGHRFAFVACSLGLVCGRLEDLDEAGGEAMTLAVGNPLTNAWRVLPRIDVKEEPCRYLMIVKRSGHYHVAVVFEEFVMDYHSKSKDWKARPSRTKERELFFTGWRLTPKFVSEELQHRFVLCVKRCSMKVLSITLRSDQLIQSYWGVFAQASVLMEGVSDIAIAFVPTLAVP
ncbi:hypothetical protein SELMODRAFT_427365 [Selaginella moellendorffii]|uniref:F-box domain-containing protein n=1 Tax=Selaginella moellendorffii TaxID=88036 RepID=D8SZC4_SELML|nr:hypothetical protein SELMODRAFT_427365 [Selaginella moellendorffii]